LRTQRVRIPVPSFAARPGDRGAATSGIDDQAEMGGLQSGCSASQSAYLGEYGFRRALTMKIGMLAALAGLAVSIAVRLAGWLPFLVALAITGFAHLLGLPTYRTGKRVRRITRPTLAVRGHRRYAYALGLGRCW
jgi:hypothetical protein